MSETIGYRGRRGDKLDPKGTPPLPVRRSTKHKRPEYGLELMAKHAARKARRAAAAKKAA